MYRRAPIFQILFFLVLSISIQCQDYTWKGGDGLWNDPQNWYPSGVPQVGDEVFIAKGTVIVDNGFSAEAKFVEVHVSGGIKVLQNSSLVVADNVNNAGILNHGVIETQGVIESNGHSGNLFDGVGVNNFGKFFIYAQGSYSSTACGGYAILNGQSGLWTNEGTISIVNNGSGIRNHGSFNNYYSIFIDELDQSHGVTNHGNFRNEAGSILRIQGTNSFGIISSEMTGLGQVPDFVNGGKINVRASDWWCIIVVDGTFTNLSNGTISLLQSTYSGLSVDGTSSFDNRGTIVTQNHGQDGIRGIGNLINSGFINSSNNTEHGIRFFDIWTPEVGSLVNSGEIELYNNDIDIYLEVELHNTDEGYIYTENSIEGSEIINDGIFSTWHNGSHNITFENNGVVEDVYNSMPNIQNNQIVIRPLNGPLVSGVTFFNALDKASASNTTISFGWYDQIANGNAGALYFFWTNSIYPNSNGAAAPTLWMDATIQSSGQKKRLRVNVLNAPNPLAHNSEDNAVQSLNNPNIPRFKIYPNPAVNSINIEITESCIEHHVFKLFDVSGKEILSQNVRKRERIELPMTIRDGMYFGVFVEGGEVIHREKVIVSRGKLGLDF